MPEAFGDRRGWARTAHEFEDAKKAETHIGRLIGASLPEIGPGHFTIDSAFGRESVVPSSNQHSEPALAPPRTIPRSHAARRTTSIPCAFQIACWLSVFPPDTTIASMESSTSSHPSFCVRLSMNDAWSNGCTLRGAQVR